MSTLKLAPTRFAIAFCLVLGVKTFANSASQENADVLVLKNISIKGLETFAKEKNLKFLNAKISQDKKSITFRYQDLNRSDLNWTELSLIADPKQTAHFHIQSTQYDIKKKAAKK